MYQPELFSEHISLVYTFQSAKDIEGLYCITRGHYGERRQVEVSEGMA